MCTWASKRKPAAKANGRQRKTEDAAKAGFAAAALNPGTVDRADGYRRAAAAELSGLYAEKFRTGEAFQEIDPQGMTTRDPGVVQQAAIDPAPLIKEQSAFATDLAQLWQRIATDIFSAKRSEPVISPAKQDKRFRNEAWTENPVFDYLKQSYLLMSQLRRSHRCAA